MKKTSKKEASLVLQDKIKSRIIKQNLKSGDLMPTDNELIEQLGGEVVKIIFLIELEGLKGREKLSGYDVDAVIKYAGK